MANSIRVFFKNMYMLSVVIPYKKRMLKVYLGSVELLLSKKTGLENLPSGNVWNPHPGGHPPLSFKN